MHAVHTDAGPGPVLTGPGVGAVSYKAREIHPPDITVLRWKMRGGGIGFHALIIEGDDCGPASVLNPRGIERALDLYGAA